MANRHTGIHDEQLEQFRDICKRSLAFLCTQMLNYKDWDLVHDDLELFMLKPARKKALILPRGHLKSTFVTIAYSIQQILRNPNVRILIANQVWDMSRTFLREIKAQLENSHLKHLFGNFVSAKWNEDMIITAQRTKPLKEPTILTTGVEAETTGGHFDEIILDDLTGLQNSQTPDQREKTKRFRRSMINLLEPGGRLIELGTRWHLDDTFSVIFEKELKYYDVMVRKVVEDGKIIFPKHFAKKFDPLRKDWTLVDDPTCMDYIKHLKESMPLDEYLAQYENDPVSSENQLFKPEMFRYWNQKPEGLYVGMAVDFALSEQRHSDGTAIVTMGMDREYNVYLLDYLVLRSRSPQEIINSIFNERDKWRPYVVGMEINGFQRALKIACEDEMRRRRDYFPVEEIKTGPENTKETRIKSLEPFYRNGRVFHAAWMKGKDVETELQTFPKQKHDDIIDAMSMCLPFLHPGIEQRHSGIKEGSWEWWFQKAEAQNMSFRGFFNHGL